MRILRKNVSQTISLRTAESKIAARVKQKDPVLMAGSINVASLRCWPTKGTASTTKAMAIRICLSRGGNCLELITVWAKREDVDWASRRNLRAGWAPDMSYCRRRPADLVPQVFRTFRQLSA